MKIFRLFFILLFLVGFQATAAEVYKGAVLAPKKGSQLPIKPLVYGSLISRLGNQFFQVAAALSLGFDAGVPVYFPDFNERKEVDIKENAKRVFFRLDFSRPGATTTVFSENGNLIYQPIPYSPGINIVGYFQSEKYFAHNWQKIQPYFEPSAEILKYLNLKYPSLLSHPATVAVHVRNYIGEHADHVKIFEILGREYYDKAAEYFADDALFVIFSDDMRYARLLFAGFNRPHIFIEGNHYVNDFYLMTMMKHTIIANSSFSWWGAYMNKNPYKIVIAPKKWFHPNYHAKDNDIRPPQWLVL